MVAYSRPEADHALADLAIVDRMAALPRFKKILFQVGKVPDALGRQRGWKIFTEKGVKLGGCQVVQQYLARRGKGGGQAHADPKHLAERLVCVTRAHIDTLDRWNERSVPGFLISTIDAVRSVKKLRELGAKTGAQIVTGHAPDAWQAFATNLIITIDFRLLNTSL